MYYVIYVGSGKESGAKLSIEKEIPQQYYSECFHLVRHMRKKIHGEWKDIYEKIVPGYLFISSDTPDELYQQLRHVPMLTKMLGREMEEGDVLFQALAPQEERWLNLMLGNPVEPEEDPIVELSQIGFDENDQVKILSGPLENMTGMIKKINLHKRIAEVEVDFLGRKLNIHLGIEILGKDS